MSRGVVSRMSACGSSGYPYNTALYIDPDNNDNPTTGTETAGAYLYKWDHDNSGDEWHKEMNLVFGLDWESGENLPYFSLSPYSTGVRMVLYGYPVDPAWAQDMIDHIGMSQDGTWGNYDDYPFTLSDLTTLYVSCDGQTLPMTTLNDGGIMLWTADNDAYAVLLIDAHTTSDDTALEAALAAANPNLWSTDNFLIKILFS